MLKTVHSPNFVYRFYHHPRHSDEEKTYFNANKEMIGGYWADIKAMIAFRKQLRSRARFRTRSAALVTGAGIDEMVIWEQQVTLLVCKVEGLEEELQKMSRDVYKAMSTASRYRHVP